MKKPTPLPRASHVNSGTSIPHEELPWPSRPGPVLRHHKIHVEHDARPDITSLGGLALPLALLRRLKAAQTLDANVDVFKRYLPYHESDHIICQALMLYAGGSCLEDMAMLQQDQALLKILGAERTPDPTTSGDFLRRFVPRGKLESLRAGIDEVQETMWKNPKRWSWSRKRKRKPLAVLHLDGHLEQTSSTREGADFNYKGKWSYSILVASLADGECVGLRLRGGNVRSSDGAAELLDDVLPRLLKHFETVLVLADSDYDRADLRHACEGHGCYFAFVGRETPDRPAVAAQPRMWRSFQTRAKRAAGEREAKPSFKRRKKKRNRRKRRARQRGYKELKLARQAVAETEGPGGTRLIIRRQILDVSKGKSPQREMWKEVRYRYVVTNLPSSWSAEDVLDETYKRCDQENIMAGLHTGIAAWRMPVAQLRGNAAWLEIARLAWNLGKWTAQLGLPKEVIRWEWKRFRRAFVNIPVQVVRTARQLRVRVLGKHRYIDEFLSAHACLQV